MSKQKPKGEAPITIVLNGPAASAIRRVAQAMGISAEDSAYSMVGIGLGVYMQRMGNKLGFDELVDANGKMRTS